MLSAELTRRRKQNLKNTIRGGAITPAGWMKEWEQAYLSQNKQEIVRIIKKYKYLILLAAQYIPEPASSVIMTIANAPESSIEFKLAMDKIMSYSPASLFGL